MSTLTASPTHLDALLHRLEWRVLRQLDGRVQGGYRTSRRGSGLDFAGLRAYADGDDARHIDWNVTARLDEPMVREFTEDRELTSWLVLDRSASMSVGGAVGVGFPRSRGKPTPNTEHVPCSASTSHVNVGNRQVARGKQDVLVELALVLARLLGRSGNRVGAVLYDQGSTPTIVPPGTGRRQALRIGRELERAADATRTAAHETTDLAAMLSTVATLARRSLVVVVSDLIGTGEWERPLIRLAHRNEVVALRVVDGADDALPQVGLVVVEDAETGEQMLVDSGDPWFRARFREGVDARDAELVSGTRRAGVPLHRVDTNADLVATLVAVVADTRRRPRGRAS